MPEDGKALPTPVEWAEEAAVSRRGFAQALFSVSCAALAGTGLERAAAAVGGRRAWPQLRLHAARGLAPGDAAVFEYPDAGDACLLIRLDEQRYVAYSQKCTHLQCPVHYKKEDETLLCPCHVGVFDARTGRVVAGPPPRPLPSVTLERRGEELWAVGVEA